MGGRGRGLGSGIVLLSYVPISEVMELIVYELVGIVLVLLLVVVLALLLALRVWRAWRS